MMNQSYVTPFESGRARAKAVTVLLSIGMLLDVVAIVSGLAQISLLKEIASGQRVPLEVARANDLRQLIVTVAQAVVYILTVVAFLMWLHRTAGNLTALGIRNPEFTPGWAVGWFFIPFMNLYRPYQVVKEIYQGSDPEADPADDLSWRFSNVTPLIGIWWGAWLISNITSQASFRISMENKVADMLLIASWFGLVADLVSMIAAVLLIFVIRSIETRQEVKSRRFTALSLPPPPPIYHG